MEYRRVDFFIGFFTGFFFCWLHSVLNFWMARITPILLFSLVEQGLQTLLMFLGRLNSFMMISLFLESRSFHLVGRGPVFLGLLPGMQELFD